MPRMLDAVPLHFPAHLATYLMLGGCFNRHPYWQTDDYRPLLMPKLMLTLSCVWKRAAIRATMSEPLHTPEMQTVCCCRPRTSTTRLATGCARGSRQTSWAILGRQSACLLLQVWHACKLANPPFLHA